MKIASVSTRVFDVRAREAAPPLFCVSQNLAYYLGTVSSDPRLTVLAVTITRQSKPNPTKCLASAVFTQALRDCGILKSARIERKVQKEAIDFLTSGGEAFQFWCRALDLHPERLRSELKRRLTQRILKQ